MRIRSVSRLIEHSLEKQKRVDLAERRGNYIVICRRGGSNLLGHERAASY